MKPLKLIAILSVFSFIPVNAQIISSKLDAVTGISAREYIHVGLRYQYSDVTQLGLAIGGDMEIRSEKITTYSLDHMVHFGQLSYYSNRPVWYARQGFTYSINVIGDDFIKKYSYLNLSLGREFPVNNWLGFNADIGFIWQFNEKVEENQTVRKYNYWYTLPLARFQAFISF